MLFCKKESECKKKKSVDEAKIHYYGDAVF